MADSARHDEDQGTTHPLHVLIVDDDATELKRTGLLLLDAGYDVSRRNSMATVIETITRLLPDFILIDPLIHGLDFAELVRCCRALQGPRIALHSKVLRYVLHRALSFKDVVGVIQKTDDQLAFLQAFQELAKDVPRRQSLAPRSELLSPAVSGTHLIGNVHAFPLDGRVVRRG
jgi:CheY-like chemotaxis protein